MALLFMFLAVRWVFPCYGVLPDIVSVTEGDSIVLLTGIERTQQDRIRWYFNDTRIAQINGDPSKTCTDVQCNDDTEGFSGRLKLDHQTGSLTIMNARNTDSGEYTLKLYSSISISDKTFSVSVHGVSSVAANTVSEGDSVTLHTGVKKTQEDRIRWYFNDTRIAQINGDPSKTCTDVQCNDGTESFSGRLKLDLQTGSLTIMNARNTDSGYYTLKMYSSSSISEKTFSVSVYGLTVDDTIKKKSVNEGESVTLDPNAKRNPNDVMMWYFDGALIAEITKLLIKICTEGQCNKKFGDRLNVDHQNGSLIITQTRTTDSGVYEVEISRHRQRRSISSKKSFNVTVIGSSLSLTAVVCVSVLLVVFAVVAVIYYHKRRSSDQRESQLYEVVNQNSFQEKNDCTVKL